MYYIVVSCTGSCSLVSSDDVCSVVDEGVL